MTDQQLQDDMQDSVENEESPEDSLQIDDPVEVVAENDGDVETEPADADRPDDSEADDADPLTTGDTENAPQDETPDEPEFIPAKDYKELQKFATRAQQELKRIQAQFEHQERSRQAEAEKLQLKVWNKAHPEHDRWTELQSKKQFWNQALSKAKTPEQRAALEDAAQGHFSPDDIQLLEQEAQWRQHQEYLRQSDPDTYYEQIERRAVQRAMSELERRAEVQRYEQQYLEVFKDPTVSDFLKSHPEEAQRALQSIADPDMAADYIKRLASANTVTTELAKSQRQAAHARAQRQANQKSATVSRDQAQRKFVDVRQESERRANERGIRLNDPAYMDIVGEVLSETQS